ncbi:hypothetical protein KR093_000743 [Drosophila rubida]|uniref:TOM1-like protein 2 n=1 Tax=Drosophila rubida TaxID=30044 RepID=A0AAD4JXJ0_9MUSC|nr:hypothetical protein KR093_000743 [Drosophila rubida]
MASFFSVGALGNVFSTPIGQRIESATDASLASENWAANMEICDMINESSDTARDAMRAIRKRLSQNAGKNNQVIMYTLTVLETCVKNCGKAFHMLVAQKDFINDLVKLIGPKNDPPAVMQEKVLSLIQIWADAFKNQPDLNGVTQMYMELKNKGIEFPPTDLDSTAPIYTPQRSVPEVPHPQFMAAQHHAVSPQHVAAGAAVAVPTGPLHLTPEHCAKLRSELEIVSNNMSILAEMLSVLKPGQETPDDYALLNELTATCKEMQSRIVDLIGRVQDDELTAEFLRINDELNNVFLRHQRYEKNRAQGNVAGGGAAVVTSPSAVLGAAMGLPVATPVAATATGAVSPSNAAISNTPQSDQLLIDLIESSDDQLPQTFGQMQLGATGGAAAAAAIPAAAAADEFDMLAQSRTDGNNRTDLLRDIPSVDAAAGSVASPYRQPKQSPTPQQQGRGVAGDPPVVSKSTKENEIDEMEAWLGSSDIDGIEELTSSEFDKFLEERAAAAENLPTINASNSAASATTGLGSGSGSGLALGPDSSLRNTTPKKPGADEDLLAL